MEDKLEIGKIVNNKLFLGYLLTAMEEEKLDAYVMYETLHGIKDKNKVLEYVKQYISFKYLFLDFKDKEVKEINVLYTAPIDTKLTADNDLGMEATIGLLHELAEKQCVWKNGLNADLKAFKIYTRENLKKYFDRIYLTYIECLQAMTRLGRGENPQDVIYDMAKDRLHKEIEECGYFRVGTTGFIVKQKRKYHFLIIVKPIREEKLFTYLEDIQKKRVKKPSEIYVSQYSCGVNASEETFKKFYVDCSVLMGKVETEVFS